MPRRATEDALTSSEITRVAQRRVPVSDLVALLREAARHEDQIDLLARYLADALERLERAEARLARLERAREVR